MISTFENEELPISDFFSFESIKFQETESNKL